METPKIALYLRLSRDDEREGESQSIENQRRQLQQFVASKGWTVTDEFVDDGFTGTNFDRPAFQEMLGALAAGQVNTVVTKDLSRLGRDQIMTAYYYQIYFPQRGIRYIAVAEGFDTANDNSSNMLFPFLTAANDFYTADISRKVRSALMARKQEGKFIGSNAPLGYQKDPNDKGHLLLEPEGAQIIEKIFQTYQRLGSIVGVAKTLSEEGIPTPAEYRKGGATGSRFPGVWSSEMVRRILTNPTYAGHLTQHRTEKINYKVEKRKVIPRSGWIIVPNTHEPIISQEEFDQVQEMIRVRSYRSEKGPGHLLTGLAYCADCGSPMTYVKESAARTYMVCQGYRMGGRLRLCSAHCAREDKVISVIQDQLRQLSKELNQEKLKDAVPQDRQRKQLERRQKQARQKAEEQKTVMNCLYRDRASGLLEESEFTELFASARAERKKQEAEAERCQSLLEACENQLVQQERVRELLSFETLDRGTLTALVEKVLIHADKTIEILFRFQQPS